MKMKLYLIIFIIGCLGIISSCNKRNDYNGDVEVIREWNFNLSSSNENYLTAGTGATAAFHMVALADSSIRYEVRGDTSAADRITTAQIRLGDPVTEGGTLLLNLPVRVYGTYASGLVTGLTPGVMDALLNKSTDKYINIMSDRAPNGLVRGQLNLDLVFSKNVALTGTAVVPSVTTTTTGAAFLRLTADNVLYSKVVVNNNDPADPVTTATVNQGAATANGPVVLNLATSGQEFGVGKKSSIGTAVSSALLNNGTYVTVNSPLKPAGKLRGQIR